MPEPGWLDRQFCDVKRDQLFWPPWLQGRGVGIELDPGRLYHAAPHLIWAVLSLRNALIGWDDNGLQMVGALKMSDEALAKAGVKVEVGVPTPYEKAVTAEIEGLKRQLAAAIDMIPTSAILTREEIAANVARAASSPAEEGG